MIWPLNSDLTWLGLEQYNGKDPCFGVRSTQVWIQALATVAHVMLNQWLLKNFYIEGV